MGIFGSLLGGIGDVIGGVVSGNPVGGIVHGISDVFGGGGSTGLPTTMPSYPGQPIHVGISNPYGRGGLPGIGAGFGGPGGSTSGVSIGGPGGLVIGSSTQLPTGGVPRGYHINKTYMKYLRSKAEGGHMAKPNVKHVIVKNRRMNPLNPHALRVAARREAAAVNIMKRVLHGTGYTFKRTGAPGRRRSR